MSAVEKDDPNAPIVSNRELLIWLQQMHGYQQAMNGKLDELAAMHAELPEHLRPAWPETEWTFVQRLPVTDPTAMLEVVTSTRPNGLHFRVLLNGYLVLWDRDVFFQETAK